MLDVSGRTPFPKPRALIGPVYSLTVTLHFIRVPSILHHLFFSLRVSFWFFGTPPRLHFPFQHPMTHRLLLLPKRRVEPLRRRGRITVASAWRQLGSPEYLE